MSLALSLNPCTGFNLAGTHFRPGELSLSAVVDGYLCTVWAHPVTERCWLPAANGGGLDLAIGGRVWLDMWVWDASQSQFVRGGYLEEREFTYTFNSTPLSFRALGLRPAAYSGGVKIEGLYSPPNAWTNFPGVSGAINLSYAQPFDIAGVRQSVVNWSTINYRETDPNAPAMSADHSGIVANDIRWSVTPYSRARSAQTQRAGVGFVPNGGTR